MKRWLAALCLGLLVPALAGTGRIAHASEDGPGVSVTRACDLGAFLHYMRADGTVFTSTRQCAVYADNGGALYPILDLRLAVGLDARLCLPSSPCDGIQTKLVTLSIRNVPRMMRISGSLVNLAGFGFSPDSTVTVRYMVNGSDVSRTFSTHASGFFSLTGSGHVTVPCGMGGVTFAVTDDATGLVRTVTPELYC